MAVSSRAVEQFRLFQEELDAKYNKHETVVKISRDITVESKRLIFLLHRMNIFSPHRDDNNQKILKDADDKIQAISKKWQKVASVLKGEDSHAFIRAYSAGLQEFIEAMSFLYYFKNEQETGISDIWKCLATMEDLQKILIFDSPNENDATLTRTILPIPILDYLLGIADTTGEFMRLCINSASKVTSEPEKIQVLKLCAFIRVLYEMFLSFSSIIDDSPSRKKYLQSKVDVMKSSLQKVEDTCYQLGLRDKELLDSSLKTSQLL